MAWRASGWAWLIAIALAGGCGGGGSGGGRCAGADEREPNDTPESATTMTIDEHAQGVLCEEVDTIDHWRIAVDPEGTSVLQVGMQCHSFRVGLSFTLFDEEGVELASNICSPSTTTGGLFHRVDGSADFIVAIEESDPTYGADGTQGYSLLATLCLTEGPSEDEPNDTFEIASPAEIGQDIHGALCETDVDVFVFEDGVEGETVSVTSSVGFPRLTLLDASGQSFASSGTAESLTAQLPNDGTFYLRLERRGLLFDREYSVRVDR